MKMYSQKNIKSCINVDKCVVYKGALKSFRPNNEKTNLQFQNYFYFST